MVTYTWRKKEIPWVNIEEKKVPETLIFSKYIEGNRDLGNGAKPIRWACANMWWNRE